MAVERSFMVKLLGDAKQLINEFRKTEASADAVFGKGGLGGKLSSMIPSFKTLAIAGTAAFGAITTAAGFAVKAAAEDEESQRLLKQALDNTFGATQNVTAETEKFVEQMMFATATADDELRPALSTLIRATGDLTQAQDLLKLGLDISAGSGRDLQSVSIALARAANGQFTALTRLGIPLSEAALKSKNLGQITNELKDAFEGSAEAAANTSAGKFRKFSIAVGELQEQFGTLLLPTVTKIAEYFTETLIPAVALAINTFRSSGVKAALAYFVASFGQAGLTVIEILRNVSLAIVSLGGQTQKAAAIIALAAVPIVGLKGAYDLYNDIVSKSTSTQASLNKTFDNFRGSVINATNVLNAKANPAIVAANERMETFGVRTRKTKTEVEGLGDEVEDTGNKVAKTTKELSKTDKIAEYTKVLQDARRASDAFGRSQERVADSKQSLDEANLGLAEAEAALRKAQAAGTPGEIADAQRGVAAAQRQVARAGFNIEEAVIAVRKAEQDLADLRSDPESTPDAIRIAEISLAEAKFEVADAEDNQINSTRDLTEARRQLRITTEGLRDGDAELLPFQKAVTDAQKAQAKAIEDNDRILKEHTETLEKYKEALKELADVAGKFPGVAGKVGASGLIPVVPGVPEPVPVYTPGQESQLAALNVTVQAGLATDGAEVGRIIADYLRDFTRIAGPLQAYGLVT
jgi:hypothetical protein